MPSFYLFEYSGKDILSWDRLNGTFLVGIQAPFRFILSQFLHIRFRRFFQAKKKSCRQPRPFFTPQTESLFFKFFYGHLTPSRLT
ncbi:hypothetical protein GMLC_03840 [Geomonas limicola]|uniref:Uncharacterized protein n=1 Tax=Geomonas limicola TaxID=2740186 RepID=A0A6V8N2M8_9BACT|nr:hypothetical protein GMLC_03840 [Geomonas limicola]